MNTTREHWLRDVKEHGYVFLYPRNDLDSVKGQAALDAAYGKGAYRCSTHGGAFRAALAGDRRV